MPYVNITNLICEAAQNENTSMLNISFNFAKLTVIIQIFLYNEYVFVMKLNYSILFDVEFYITQICLTHIFMTNARLLHR